MSSSAVPRCSLYLTPSYHYIRSSDRFLFGPATVPSFVCLRYGHGVNIFRSPVFVSLISVVLSRFVDKLRVYIVVSIYVIGIFNIFLDEIFNLY